MTKKRVRKQGRQILVLEEQVVNIVLQNNIIISNAILTTKEDGVT